MLYVASQQQLLVVVQAMTSVVTAVSMLTQAVWGFIIGTVNVFASASADSEQS